MALMLKFTHRLDESSDVRKAMMMDPDQNFRLTATLSGADACTLNPIYEIKRYNRKDIVR